MNRIVNSLSCLKEWIENRQYKGYDPYDGLNSPLVRSLPLGKYGKIAAIQLNKRSPVNFRKILGVKKEYNPKGLALILKGYANLYGMTPGKDNKEKMELLSDILMDKICPGYSGCCWGYNFDWQSRAFFVPEGTPNVICTVFAGSALLDMYEMFKDDRHLKSARSACDFILNDLNITDDNDGICLSYTPIDSSQIHNASLLAASLLARVYSITGQENLRDMAVRAVAFSLAKQNADGSWRYGTADNQKWVDNFHTGYNLNALEDCRVYGKIDSIEENIQKGYSYYKEHLFYGAVPKYYNNNLYPIDIHSVAQSILTFLRFGDIKSAEETATWGIDNMQDKKGYFYFQKKRSYTNKIPYMRWGQAWMFHALSSIMTEREKLDKYKIINVAGARPNFMKIAPIMEAMNKSAIIDPILVHTGQHYDEKMSRLFFRDLDIPEPDVDLGVGSGTHAVQTARIMMEFEKVLIKENPDLVLVVGDVNSTLACSVVSAKLNIPVAHVEAGLRSRDRKMPEEINRIVTDALSSYLFTTCREADENLLDEGIDKDKIFFVGNTMIDTLRRLESRIRKIGLVNNGKPYAVLTLHRPSNVDDEKTLTQILKAIDEIQKKIDVIFPAHPRTLKNLKKFDLMDDVRNMEGIKLTEPVGYLEFMNMVINSKMVLTDSGGIQEETTVLGVPCITLRENTERPITIVEGTNVLAGPDTEKIITEAETILSGRYKKGNIPELWDGKSAKRIVEILENELSKK